MSAPRAGSRTRHAWLVARTVFTEALRRKEIYVIVLVTMALLLAAASLRFFELKALHKFYQEMALKTMSVATALTTIVLAARQLPREFERRTIYTLLAKPVARWEFLAGKYAGVVCAGWFCLALFMGVYCVARLAAPAPFNAALFAQYFYLQMLLVMVLAALTFLLSLVANIDAAITVSMLLYLLGEIVTNALTVLYDYLGPLGRGALRVLNYCVPQPSMFDLSNKIVHGWEPLHGWVMALATGYAVTFIAPYLALSYLLFRRKAL